MPNQPHHTAQLPWASGKGYTLCTPQYLEATTALNSAMTTNDLDAIERARAVVAGLEQAGHVGTARFYEKEQ